MAASRERETADPAPGQKGETIGEAIAELVLEAAQFFFRVRAVGQRMGLFTSWGGGAFGFMRSLALLGPLTVPQIAAMRPTSRQRMQRLANELARERLVEFVENPRHRRSKLVRLTAKGEARFRQLNVRFVALAAAMGGGLNQADVRKATEILRRLSKEGERALTAAGVFKRGAKPSPSPSSA